MEQTSVLAEPMARPRRFDGRRLRSERTRQLLIEAYLELLARNVRAPTASQIARQAGYSVRSIFERFSDLRALGLAATDHAIAVGQAEAVARDVDGDRSTRINSHVQIRARACEKWLPLWQALVDTQDKMAELKARMAAIRQGNLDRLELMYGPELSVLAEPERGQLLLSLGALTSFESWNLMRHDYGMSAEDAEAAWRNTIDRVLPPTP